MKLPEPLEKLSQVKHAKAIGIAATMAIGILMLFVATMIDPEMGYYLMMVGLVAVVFIVPYLFGWRDGKMLAVIGIGMFLALGAINGPLVVHNAYSADEPDAVSSELFYDWQAKSFVELEDGYYENADGYYGLTNGTLDIFKGDPGVVCTFKVTLVSNATFTSTPDIRLGYARGIWGVEDTPSMAESDPTDNDYEDGKEFVCNVTMPKTGIHSHWFAIVLDEGGDLGSVNTSVALGPLVGSEVDNWGTYIPVGAASMFCNIGLLFLIIVLLYWWLGTAREKRKVWDQALREKEGEPSGKKPMDDALEEAKPFSCDKCGAGVGADDNFCPKCGERFDGVVDEPEGKGGAGAPEK